MIGPSQISNSIHVARTGATGRHPRGAMAAATIALVLVLLLSGCGDRGDVGIFASIEREEKIEKSNLPEVSTAGSMVYDAGEDKYYVALGQLYSRGRNSSDWDDVSHPSGYKDGHTLDIVSVNGTIYVAFFDTISTKAELFTLNPSNDNFSKVWSPGKEISKLIGVDSTGDGVNDQLFAVTVNSNKKDYDLVYAPGDIGGSQNTVLSGVTQIIDGTVDYIFNSDTTYRFIAKGQLYGGTDPTASFAPLAGPFANYGGTTFAQEAFGDAAKDWLLVTSPKGDIAYSTDGGSTWTTNSGDNDRRYTDIAYVDFPDFTGLVVGLDTRNASSGGYYEVNESLGTSRPDGDNYRAADISDASIHGFYVDSANDTLFALTNGDGLWSASYDGGEPEWRWE
ncbi:MAG: hypothetical protein GVY29_01365 [Spirochaetes bacterium]|jgi:hypothetical protein|nr:hypothetical protein [Spirochaetota bacterium]